MNSYYPKDESDVDLCEKYLANPKNYNEKEAQIFIKKKYLI